MQKQQEYVTNEHLKQLSLLAMYGIKYKQYLNDEYPISSVHQYRRQLTPLNSELLNIVELLAELDTLTRLKRQKQDYCHISLKAKHIYDDNFSYIYSFRPMANSLSIFIYWLYQCISKFHTIDNIERKRKYLLGFKLSLEMYIKFFQIKKSLH